MRIHMVRHAQTNSNAEGRYCGITDVDINEKGLKQANRIAKKMENMDIDVIISSDLLRTKKTAEIINKYHDLDIIYKPELREMNFGKYENYTFDEILNERPTIEEEMLEEKHQFKFPSGDSLYETYKRANKEFEKIINEHAGKEILIVSHAIIIRSIIVKQIIEDIDKYWHIKVDNCSISTIVFNENNKYLQYLNNK